MTYDDAGWHQDTVGEPDLDPDCAATQTRGERTTPWHR